MTDGERVKEVRKSLGLTLEEFGKRVGVTKGAVSAIENGSRGLTNQMSSAICREFHVDEYWLRTGEGEMFLPRNGVLVEYMADIVTGDDELIKDIVQTYMELDEKNRQALREFVDALVEQRKKEG